MYYSTPSKNLDFSHHRIQLAQGANSSGTFPKRDMHPQYELLLSLDSGVSYAIEDKKYELKPYTLLMVPSHAYHYPIPVPPYTGYYDRYMLRFSAQSMDASLLQAVFQQPACYQLTAEHPIVQIFRQVHEYAQAKLAEHIELMLKSACTQILLNIYLLQKTSAEAPATSPSGSYPVLAYIEDHLTDIASLDQIAEHFYMSTSSLTHQFRSRMGISLMKYIRQKRLLLARSLLESGAKPLDVAARCGFREYTTFYKAYLQFFGFPPSKKA